MSCLAFGRMKVAVVMLSDNSRSLDRKRKNTNERKSSEMDSVILGKVIMPRARQGKLLLIVPKPFLVRAC